MVNEPVEGVSDRCARCGEVFDLDDLEDVNFLGGPERLLCFGCDHIENGEIDPEE
jgi:hypothetical protein